VAVLADITLDAAGSEAIADDTGGFVVRNSNDLAAASAACRASRGCIT